MRIHVDDNVLVTTGKYRGKTGKVTRIITKHNRIVVEKVNIRTRHLKKTAERAGERIQYEAPFNASNVMVICPNCKKTTRVAYLRLENGKKQRICKKCKQGLDKQFQKKPAKAKK
ncbi:MAG: 50S ribosomal protein L24 [Candidatus Peregrinibacteria bacterium GW2011_GWA2_47_7]|nr:MAG: 50S ribosomal protein L24 [Candidatus Peregrinibacteria bacterium GW2011_GWA2_47_7]